MAVLTAAAFETKYNDASTGLYRAGQVAGSIGSDDHRAQITDLKDSVVFNTDGSAGTLSFSGGTFKNSSSSSSAPVLKAEATQASGESQLSLTRTAGTTSGWDLYLPAGSADLRFFANSGDRFTFTAAGGLTCEGSIITNSELYLGPILTDGTWRFRKSGDDLLVEQREAGTYNTKHTFSGA
jgi:hypothetical protein